MACSMQFAWGPLVVGCLGAAAAWSPRLRRREVRGQGLGHTIYGVSIAFKTLPVVYTGQWCLAAQGLCREGVKRRNPPETLAVMRSLRPFFRSGLGACASTDPDSAWCLDSAGQQVCQLLSGLSSTGFFEDRWGRLLASGPLRPISLPVDALQQESSRWATQVTAAAEANENLVQDLFYVPERHVHALLCGGWGSGA